MELYGVQHGGGFNLGNETFSELPVEPSWLMLSKLDNLPAGSKIGIETSPQILAGGNSSINFTPESINYWRPIIEMCKSAGHEAIYLDDFELYKKIGILISARDKLSQYYHNNLLKLGPDAKKEIVEKIYSFSVVSDYIFRIEREEAIFKKMEQSNLDVAIIGQGHADYLVLNPASSSANVNRKAYKQAITKPPSFLSAFVENPAPQEQWLQPGEPDMAMISENEFLTRKYNAVTKGKIITGNKSWEPNWVGTWDTNCRPQGYFEMLIEEDYSYPKVLFGITEDINGTGFFDGNFNGDNIEFTKEYDPDGAFMIYEGAAKGDIKHRGKKVAADEYRGTYETSDGYRGEFILKKGKDSQVYTPKSQAEILQFAKEINLK